MKTKYAKTKQLMILDLVHGQISFGIQRLRYFWFDGGGQNKISQMLNPKRDYPRPRAHSRREFTIDSKYKQPVFLLNSLLFHLG